MKMKRNFLYATLVVIGLVIFAGYLHRMMVANQERKEMLSYYNSKGLEVAMVYNGVYIFNREGDWDKLKLDVGSIDKNTLLFTEGYIFYRDREQKNICMYNRKTFKVTRFPEGKYHFPCCFSLINEGTNLLFCAHVQTEDIRQVDTVFAKINLQSSDHVIEELYRSQEYIHPYFSKDGRVAYFNKKGYVVKLTIDSGVIERIVEGSIVGITDDAILIYNYYGYKCCYTKYLLDNGKRINIWCGDDVYAENIDRQGTCLLTGELTFFKLRFVLELSLCDIENGRRYKLPLIEECPSYSIYILKNSEK